MTRDTQGKAKDDIFGMTPSELESRLVQEVNIFDVPTIAWLAALAIGVGLVLGSFVTA